MGLSSDHFSDEAIERYEKREMTALELLAADDHLAACEVCYARLKRDEQLYNAVADAASVAGRHLTYEQMADYVDDCLSDLDREISESHLQICPRCEVELSDLQSIQARMKSLPAEKYAPRKSSGARMFWNSPAYRVPLEIAAMAVVAALAFWIASSALRSEIKDLQSQLDQQRQANTELGQQTEDARNQVAALRQENEKLQQQQSTDVALNDGGGLIVLDRQGNLSGPEPVIANQAAVKRALATTNVNVAQNLTELTGRAGKLMGGPSQSAYGLISPVGVVLINDRPTFRWLAQPGATGYEVALFDPASKKVAGSGLITATNWTVDTLLERGVIYSWQVRAIRDGKEIILPPPEAPDARFKILERAKADELERAQRSSPRSHLLLGILYAEAGMVEEAEQQFRDLVKANPESEVAKKLLSSIRKRAAGR